MRPWKLTYGAAHFQIAWGGPRNVWTGARTRSAADTLPPRSPEPAAPRTCPQVITMCRLRRADPPAERTHPLAPPRPEVPEPQRAMPGGCSAHAQHRWAQGSCVLGSRAPRPRDLLQASRAEAQGGLGAHADKPPLPAGIQTPKYTYETPETGGGRTSGETIFT